MKHLGLAFQGEGFVSSYLHKGNIIERVVLKLMCGRIPFLYFIKGPPDIILFQCSLGEVKL